MIATGWPSATETGIQIGQLRIQTRWRPHGEPNRVTGRAWPHTRVDGSLQRLHAVSGDIFPTRPANSKEVLVTGQMIRVDPSEGFIRVKVCPAESDLEPSIVTFQASRGVLALDPMTFGIRVTGRVLSVRKGILLADTIMPVHASVSEQVAWRLPRPPEIRALLQPAAD